MPRHGEISNKNGEKKEDFKNISKPATKLEGKSGRKV